MAGLSRAARPWAAALHSLLGNAPRPFGSRWSISRRIRHALHLRPYRRAATSWNLPERALFAGPDAGFSTLGAADSPRDRLSPGESAVGLRSWRHPEPPTRHESAVTVREVASPGGGLATASQLLIGVGVVGRCSVGLFNPPRAPRAQRARRGTCSSRHQQERSRSPSVPRVARPIVWPPPDRRAWGAAAS